MRTWAPGAILLAAFTASPAHADAVYAELRSVGCLSSCDPLPITQVVEISPGVFLGGVSLNQLYTLTSSGEFALQATLPNVDDMYFDTPFAASDGHVYIAAETSNGPTLFKYRSGDTLQSFALPFTVDSIPLTETSAQILIGSTAPTQDASTLFSLTFDGVATPLATEPANQAVGQLLEAVDGQLYGLGRPLVDNGLSSLLTFDGDGQVTVLSTFARAYPHLIQASDGNFYGCTESTLFRVTPSGRYKTIHRFTTPHVVVYGCPIQASDGNLYGTTRVIEANDYGTVYRSTLDGDVSTAYAFTGVDSQEASQYVGDLVQGSDGKLYGQTTGPLGAPGEYVGATWYSLDLGLPQPLPVLRAVDPQRAAAGSTVLLTGSNLLGTTSVTFGGVPASFVQASSQYLQVTIPVGAKSGAITVTTPNGTTTSRFKVRIG